VGEDQGRLNEVRAVYRDPQRMFGRSSAQLTVDLVIVGIAILNEVAELRELLEPVTKDLGRPGADPRAARPTAPPVPPGGRPRA
jgi:hypothetical protein